MDKIRAVILDLGGVILNLDQDRTLRAFKRLGADLGKINIESSLFTDYETGRISSATFRDGLRAEIGKPVTDAEIDIAWNAMLLDVPPIRFDIIRKLKKDFRVYLLSNTNEIHIESFHSYLKNGDLFEAWHAAFDEQFLSYRMGLRKPDQTIYTRVANQIQTPPEQCLFIDDNKGNIAAAADTGMKTIWAVSPLSYITLEEIRQRTSVSG